MKISRLIGLFLLAITAFTSSTMLATSPKQFLGAVFHSSPSEDSSHDIKLIDYKIEKIQETEVESTYDLTVKLQNLGEDFKYQQVALLVRPYNDSVILAQPDGNFSLKENEIHSIKHEISIPKNVAKQGLEIHLTPLSFAESDLSNNATQILIQDDTVGIKNLQLRSLTEDGLAHLDWDSDASTSETGYKYILHKYESSQSLQFNGSYFELSNAQFSYELLPFNHSFSSKYIFEEQELSNKTIDFKEDLFTTDKYRLFFLEAYNPDLEQSMYSDFVYLYPQSMITRAELAKLVVSELGFEILSDAGIFYEDVEEDDQFTPYIKTLYARGYLEDTSSFGPHELASRRYAAELMGKIFDIPLAKNGTSFEDVSSDDADFYLLKSIKPIVPALKNKKLFLADEPSSLAFVKTMIKNLSKNYEVY